MQQLEVGDTNPDSLCAGHLLQHTLMTWHSNPHGEKDETKMYACAHTGTGTHTCTHKCTTHSVGNKSWEPGLGWFLASLPPEWPPH